VRRRLVLAASLVGLVQTAAAQPAGPSAPYADAARRLTDAALADSSAYERLALFVDTFGHRLSGSDALEAAIDWALAEMRADGLEGVRGQPARVPHWVRGAESATLVTPTGSWPLAMLGLGGSVGTPPGGIEAEVLVVTSFDDLTARAADAAGRIVLFDVPFTTYGETVRYRTGGAVAAARAGAVAALVRSVGSRSQDTPHTGVMHYAEGVPRIPTAAVTAEAAARMHRMQDRVAQGGSRPGGLRPVVRLAMGAETLPDRLSRNVVARLTGRERPDERVVAGGHIDSWDVGQGAVDDGGGCVVVWEAVRLMHALGLRPRRTIEVVLWTNEENGTRGAAAYRDSLGDAAGRVQLAFESDSGVFAPVGFGLTAGAGGLDTFRAAVGPLLGGLLSESTLYPSGIEPGGGGADIGPLMRAGAPGMSLRTASESYFDVHHTDADTIDKLDPATFARAVAATAIVLYVAAEMPETLPRLGPDDAIDE
jgi:carboxypeptidase Q